MTLLELYDELVAMRNVCTVKLKTILEVGQMGSYKNIYQASIVAMLAGADFIKTSTGKECTANATLPMSLVMIQAIGDFYDATGVMVWFNDGIQCCNHKFILNLYYCHFIDS